MTHARGRKPYPYTGLAGLVFLAFVLLGSGCTSVETFPHIARAGDTVMLTVGSPLGMTRANTTVEFVDVNGVTHDLTPNVRSIFKIYPDKTSEPWLFESFASAVPDVEQHAAWTSIISLDLPIDLVPGQGTVFVTTSAIYKNTTGLTPSVNGQPIALEILPGAGEASTFPYTIGGTTRTKSLTLLEPLPQILVEPADSAPGDPQYGAVEMKLNVALIQEIDGAPATDDSIRVVLDDMSVRHMASQLQMSWTRTNDEITVMFVSPKGIMRVYEPRFSIVLSPGGSLVPEKVILDTSKPPPSLVSINYYDADGNPVTGPLPTVTVEHDS